MPKHALRHRIKYNSNCPKSKQFRAIVRFVRGKWEIKLDLLIAIQVLSCYSWGPTEQACTSLITRSQLSKSNPDSNSFEFQMFSPLGIARRAYKHTRLSRSEMKVNTKAQSSRLLMQQIDESLIKQWMNCAEFWCIICSAFDFIFCFV